MQANRQQDRGGHVNAEKSGPGDQWREAALALIRSQSIVTLATSDRTGPWAAPVYYVFLDGSFYFFSSPSSRHIAQALETGQSAAALFDASDSWQAIRGIQMAGHLKRVRQPAMVLKATAAYLKRYPFVRDFFPGNPSPDADAFFACFKARLFSFTPIEAYYTDNRFGFGNRQPIDW